MIPSSDTIVALSTPRGYSGIGVIRLSGPDAISILRKVFTPAGPGVPFPDRTAMYGFVQDPASGNILDDGIALVMRGPTSYTGEDVVEVSLHGSPVVLDMVERLLVSMGARPAGRGEFTRRAFLSGRLDLLQAEAVIDLIEAAGPSGVQEARARLNRSLSSEICRIATELKDLLAVVEAHIDFDEDDLEPRPDLVPGLASILESMDDLIRRAESGRIRRQGIKTVIVGKPNVGKSTLFNAMLRTDRAIVTPHPGTTRDSLDEQVIIDGHLFVLCDTAGVRESPEPVEEEGIRRTRALMEQADMVVVVLDNSSSLDREDLAVLAACEEACTIVVLNKADLAAYATGTDSALQIPLSRPHVRLSSKTGAGMGELERLLCREAEKLASETAVGDSASLTHRGAVLMHSATAPLRSLLERFRTHEIVEPEIVSLEVRRALGPLEEITGENVDEGILDRIFERFCVGK